MSNEVVGIVEEIMNNGKAKGSGIRVGGLKYGVFDPSEIGMDNLKVGERVSFRFKEKPSGGPNPYKNITGKVTKVAADVPATVAPSSEPTGGTSRRYRHNGEEGGFPIHKKAYERALDRRNATQVAARLAPKDVDELLMFARKIEAYTCGDLDAQAEAAMHELMED